MLKCDFTINFGWIVSILPGICKFLRMFLIGLCALLTGMVITLIFHCPLPLFRENIYFSSMLIIWLNLLSSFINFWKKRCYEHGVNVSNLLVKEIQLSWILIPTFHEEKKMSVDYNRASRNIFASFMFEILSNIFLFIACVYLDSVEMGKQ